MRSAGGTKSGPPCWVTRATKPTIARLLAPSFHDGSASLCACAGGKTGSMGANKIGSVAVAVSRARRLMPKGTDVGFMMPLPLVDERRSKARPGPCPSERYRGDLPMPRDCLVADRRPGCRYLRLHGIEI